MLTVFHGRPALFVFSGRHILFVCIERPILSISMEDMGHLSSWQMLCGYSRMNSTRSYSYSEKVTGTAV